MNTGWGRPLRVTLTHTTNKRLQPNLPLNGILRIFETDTNYRATPDAIAFRAIGPDGEPSGPWVQVPHARFTYPGR